MFFSELGAQTCCSGGVPTANNLGLPIANSNTIQFALNYDVNALNTLKTGTEKLESGSRSRLTNTLMLQTGFSLTERVSLDFFVPWLRQEREIRFLGQVSDFTATNGLGDLVLLGKYSVIKKEMRSQFLTIAAGLKAPTGSSSKINNNGLPLNADLQPGSGAWDGIFLLEYQQALGFRKSMTAFARTILTFKGINDSYLGQNTYQFGTEWQGFLGVSDRILIGKNIIDPSLAVRFRSAGADRFNGGAQTGTGGRWAFLNPSINFWKTQNFSFSIGGDIPIFSYVKDTQVTPTFRFNTGIFYRISLKDDKTNLPNFSI